MFFGVKGNKHIEDWIPRGKVELYRGGGGLQSVKIITKLTHYIPLVEYSTSKCVVVMDEKTFITSLSR
jgi:hypothetical protein